MRRGHAAAEGVGVLGYSLEAPVKKSSRLRSTDNTVASGNALDRLDDAVSVSPLTAHGRPIRPSLFHLLLHASGHSGQHPRSEVPSKNQQQDSRAEYHDHRFHPFRHTRSNIGTAGRSFQSPHKAEIARPDTHVVE